MIQLKKLSRKTFSTAIQGYSFSPVTKSPAYMGWYEEIIRCTTSNDTYLINYLFNESIWLSFLIQPDQDNVFFSSVEPVPLETIENISTGAVLKLWLQLTKKYCLHASAIVVDEEVILFMGPKGAGKSTTAAYFSSKGYPVWCDDYCILERMDQGYYALPGQSKLRIKNETIEGLSIAADHLTPLFLPVPEIERKTSPIGTFKTYYTNPVHQNHSNKPSLKVKAIFILSERGSHVEMTLRPIQKEEGMLALMNEIMLREIVSKEYMAFYFKESIHVLDTVNLFQLQAANDLSKINVVFDSILTQLLHEES